jgi:hypothetical protein
MRTSQTRDEWMNGNISRLCRVNYRSNKKWWDKQLKQLRVDNKDSSKAKFEFWIYVGRFSDLYTRSFNDDLHDLSVADPFDDPEL